VKIAYVMQDGGPDVRQKPLSGPANHVWQVFRELARMGHDMSLLARYDGQIRKSRDLRTFEAVAVPRFDEGVIRTLERLVRGTQARLHLPYANLFESYRFAEACCQEFVGHDLLYERMGWIGYGAGLAARRLKAPLVLEVNNGDLITELERLGVAPDGFQRLLAIDLMRRAVFRASHFVATGQGHRRRFIEAWGVEPERVSVVENGSELVHLLGREQLRAFHPDHTPNDDVRVVFVGAFEPWHGVLILIEALPRILASAPSVRLTLIGTGTQEAQIKERIHALDLDPYVELTGQVAIHQVAELLASADIGVAPYCGWMEYSGLKLFDYKAAALGIVASGENGQPDTLRHGDTALIVPPCDEIALGDAVVQLATNAELRRCLGRKARIEAEQYHSWQNTARQLDQILVMVVERNRRGLTSPHARSSL
jgi:glycosyltransferase involved in cell wall biosynthesis